MATAFAAMFLQQPYYSTGVGLKLRMTKEDVELMQLIAKEQVSASSFFNMLPSRNM